MKKFKIVKITSSWSSSALKREVEEYINRKSQEGYDIVSVSFGLNSWWVPAAFITISK